MLKRVGNSLFFRLQVTTPVTLQFMVGLYDIRTIDCLEFLASMDIITCANPGGRVEVSWLGGLEPCACVGSEVL